MLDADFSRDGRELFFAAAGSLKRVVIETAAGFRAGPVEQVLAGPYVQAPPTSGNMTSLPTPVAS